MRKQLPSLQDALKPDVLSGVSTGGVHNEHSGAKQAATDGLARKWKPFVITPVTLPELAKPRRI
jgi:hypothetical protein